MAKLWQATMEMLGFSKIIKIPGKDNFDQLTRPEVALMIEAFLDDGNESFDRLAFNDFLHAELENDNLKGLQADLKQNAFLPTKDDEWPAINYSYLRELSDNLRN